MLTQEKVNQLFLQATKDGNLEEVDYLLNRCAVKADIYTSDGIGGVAYCLLIATQKQNLELLQYFLEKTELHRYTRNQKNTRLNTTVFFMYSQAGKYGDMNLISYLIEQLPQENYFALFDSACLNNQVHVMDYLVKHHLLSRQDLQKLESMDNIALYYTIRYEQKEAFDYLIKLSKNYFNTESADFFVYCMTKCLEFKNKDSVQFDFFDSFFNQPAIAGNQKILLDNHIYRHIAKTDNAHFYFMYLDKITDKKLKKAIFLDSYLHAFHESINLEDAPLFKTILDNYSHYLNQEAKNQIFSHMINQVRREKFHDLMQYDWLVKSVNPNPLLFQASQEFSSQKTFHYIKDILQSPMKNRVNLHYQHNYFLKTMGTQLQAEEQLELLTIIVRELPHSDREKISPFFQKYPEVIQFLDNWKLYDKLEAHSTLAENYCHQDNHCVSKI